MKEKTRNRKISFTILIIIYISKTFLKFDKFDILIFRSTFCRVACANISHFSLQHIIIYQRNIILQSAIVSLKYN